MLTTGKSIEMENGFVVAKTWEAEGME